MNLTPSYREKHASAFSNVYLLQSTPSRLLELDVKPETPAEIIAGIVRRKIDAYRSDFEAERKAKGKSLSLRERDNISYANSAIYFAMQHFQYEPEPTTPPPPTKTEEYAAYFKEFLIYKKPDVYHSIEKGLLKLKSIFTVDPRNYDKVWKEVNDEINERFPKPEPEPKSKPKR